MKHAASYLSAAMLLFTLGRFTGSFLLRITDEGVLLMSYSLMSVLLCCMCVALPGFSGLVSLMALFFFESIMFPTIFAMGIRDLGPRRKAGSSILVMSIVGGALMPFFMGMVADIASTSVAYLVPAGCFLVVAYFGYQFRGEKTS